MNFTGIVVADSEQFIKKIITPLHLRNIQLRLDVAESEDTCLRKLESHPFDILIAYHHPPAIDILRLTRAVTSKHLPVELLVIAPPSYEDILNQSIMEGAFSYLIDTSTHYEAIPHLINRMIQSLIDQGRGVDWTPEDEKMAQEEGKLVPGEDVSSLSYQEKIKILDRLTSFVAHELKNPFTTINNALYFSAEKNS